MNCAKIISKILKEAKIEKVLKLEFIADVNDPDIIPSKIIEEIEDTMKDVEIDAHIDEDDYQHEYIIFENSDKVVLDFKTDASMDDLMKGLTETDWENRILKTKKEDAKPVELKLLFAPKLKDNDHKQVVVEWVKV